MIQGSYPQGLTCKILRLLKDNTWQFQGTMFIQNCLSQQFFKSGISFMELPYEFQMGLSYDAWTQVYVFTQRGVALDNFEKFGV